MHDNSPAAQHANLYRTIWRWHFYAGLFCIPFVIALSISGAIYLFKPQIDAWRDAPYKNLAMEGERRTANEHIAAALAAVPGGKFKAYELPASPTDAVVVALSQDHQQRVYLHPGDLSVLHISDHHHEFIQQVKHFHGELLIGNVGSVLVELAACWAMVLIVTGLYLWWPRSARGLGGVLYPRLRQGARRFWRDLHAVTGIWVAFFALFLLLSGLPWTLVWGSAFKEIRQFAASGQQIEQRHQDHEGGQGEGRGQGRGKHEGQADWDISSQDGKRRGRQAGGNHSVDLTPALLAAAHSLDFALPAELSPLHNRPGIWQLSSQTQNRPLRATALIDAASGEVIEITRFADKAALDRAIGIGIAVHEGQLFGWFNQLLGLFTALALLMLSVSGFVLWRKRKPADSLGAPSAKYSPHASHVVLAIVATAALFLPLLLISLILLLLLEWGVLRRFQPVRNWLGLAA